MKKILNIVCCFILLAFVQGCIFGTYDKKLNGGYYLSAMDVTEEMNIECLDGQYRIGIIQPTVFAVGQSADYIIAKQHPRVFPNNSDRSITNYFIIPLKNKISESPEKNIYGPLNLDEFVKKRKDLGIQEIEFTIIFDDLE